MKPSDVHPSVAYGLLAVLVAGAGWMRLADLQDTTFLLDSAWVLIWVDNIVHLRELPLLGARMTSGGFLGPAITYLLVPVGLISGAPEAFAAGIALANLLAVVLVFLIGRRYFGWRVGLLSALFLGYNFHAIGASRGVWNPFLVPVFSALLTLQLLRFFVDGAARALIGIALCLSILLQLHPHAAVLVVYCLLLAVLLPRPAVSRSIVVVSLSIPAVLFLPVLLFDVGNEFYNTKQIVAGWSTLQPSALPMTARAATFFSINVFGDRLFRSLFLLAIAFTVADLARHWSEPAARARRLVLFLPAALLFLFMVIVGRFPLVPRFMQSLMVPAALLCGLTADQIAAGVSRWLGERRVLADAALVACGLVYIAVVTNTYQTRAKEYGLGHLAAIRKVVRLVVEDSGSSGASNDNVFVCEDGSRDLGEYGRAYGYMLRLVGGGAASDARLPTVYMISDFVRSEDDRIGSVEGVSVYRYRDLSHFAVSLLRFPGAACHRAVPENFPFRTG